MSTLQDKYAFGSFELVPDRGVLLLDGVPVPMGSRAVKILTILAQRAGKVVSGQDLLEQVWPEASVVESNLRVHVTNIRKHLLAATGETNAILTVPGQGYQFNLAVKAYRTTSKQRTSTNLPSLWTELVGREEDLARLQKEVEDHRFVTIVGSGGIGKTSVAIAEGWRAAEMHEDGAIFVDFTTSTTRAMLASRIAGALRLPVSTSTIESSIIEYLRDKDTLLIVDNCEHVIEPATELIEGILRECGSVHVLATSRQPLQGEGEHLHLLPALTIPPSDRGTQTAAEVLVYAAPKLFVERAQASQSWFVLTDVDAPHLVSVCNRLGGIPLAIELAAARVDLFSLESLTKELDSSLDLLTRGRRTAQERHKTLRATLDWSYGLLSKSERLLLNGLSVFQGAFDREGAAAVVSDSTLTEDQIMEGITSLAAKSLIFGAREGQFPIYRLLESTREYAFGKLRQEADISGLRKRHALYHRDLSKKLAPQNGFVTPGGLDRYRRLIDEVRSAIAWAFSPEGDATLGIELAVASAYIWYQVSLLGEYTEVANQALAAMRGMPDSGKPELELLLAKAVGIFDTLGSVPELRASAERALELATRLDDHVGIAWALSILWRYHHGMGDYEQSLEVTEQLKIEADAGHDSTDLYTRLAMLSQLYLGHLNSARKHALAAGQFVRNKELSLRGAYDYDTNAFIKSSMARIYWLQGYVEQASALADESVELALDARHSTGVCFALAMGGCAVKLWNAEFQIAERNIALMQDYSRAANSMYWQNYVEVFRSGLVSAMERYDARTRRELGIRSQWDSRHWENFSVLRAGYAPMDMLERAHRDRSWWCAPEILRLEAERLCFDEGTTAKKKAESLLRLALDVATEQGALLWRLRVLTSLVQMRRGEAGLREATDLLSATVNEFSEGFEFPDLRKATTLLGRRCT
jgi:predicted ATPase/DNA-binding winged helix-turn-helix (wHTH) protein